MVKYDFAPESVGVKIQLRYKRVAADNRHPPGNWLMHELFFSDRRFVEKAVYKIHFRPKMGSIQNDAPPEHPQMQVGGHATDNVDENQESLENMQLRGDAADNGDQTQDAPVRAELQPGGNATGIEQEIQDASVHTEFPLGGDAAGINHETQAMDQDDLLGVSNQGVCQSLELDQLLDLWLSEEVEICPGLGQDQLSNLLPSEEDEICPGLEQDQLGNLLPSEEDDIPASPNADSGFDGFSPPDEHL